MPQFVPIEELFKGRHFDQEIVILCVRWYLSFKLSYRDLVTMKQDPFRLLQLRKSPQHAVHIPRQLLIAHALHFRIGLRVDKDFSC